MKRLFRLCTLAIAAALTSGCAKYTDIIPKGQNLLDNANDLDQLMNIEYYGDAFNSTKQSVLINDMYPPNSNIPNIISGVSSLNKIWLTYDENADRIGLTVTDPPYQGLYKIISTANIALRQAHIASGDSSLLNQIRAEAYIARAYCHYRLVNIYAKAYNPNTAEKDGGIPYVKDINFETDNVKSTVKEVYNYLLDDINNALALNALPDQPANSMRFGKAFAYSVKALVLQSMLDYPGSLEAAKLALSYNSVLEDHRPLLNVPKASRQVSRTGLTATDNIFYAYYGLSYPSTFSPSYEILNEIYEKGNIFKDSTNLYDYDYGKQITGLPNIPIWGITMQYQQNAGGITTSDMLLVKAEALIRSNRIEEGMVEINKLRERRISPYTPLFAKNEAEAMEYLQRISRIELLFTLKNFVNIKRWNNEGKYPIRIKRNINGVTYNLDQNSSLWIFPFPQNATEFNSKLIQNY